jgi:hypothetical protein
VPDYRKIAAPILWAFDVPYQGLVTQVVNVQSLPEGIRERINEIVPLNQSVDELEALASQCEAQHRQLELGVFGGDLLMSMWNQDHPYGRSAVAMYWSIDTALIRGVLGQIRTALTEFVVKLRAEVGDSEELPSAEQTDGALRVAVPSAVFNNSTVTFVTASTKIGDIMSDGPRTTIKNNKTTIRGSTGNVTIASSHVAQVNGDDVDVEKIRQFADLLTQIAPTLGLAADQQAELQAGTDDLHVAIGAPGQENGYIRRALERVLGMLRVAGPSAAQKIAVSMGDDLIRELSSEILRELPH